jgi:hypothetical protein
VAPDEDAGRVSDSAPGDPSPTTPASVPGSTIREQTSWARSRLPGTTVNLQGGAPAVIGPSLEQLDRLARIYPEVAARIQRFGLEDLGTGHVGVADVLGRSRGPLPGQPASLALNRAYFSRPGRLLRRLDAMVRRGWHPSGTAQVESIVTHEFGHHLWYLLEDEGFDPRWFFSTLAGDRRSLSSYAEEGTDRDGETFAEAFVAHHLGDEDARNHPLTRSVVEFIERSMRLLRERRGTP